MYLTDQRHASRVAFGTLLDAGALNGLGTEVHDLLTYDDVTWLDFVFHLSGDAEKKNVGGVPAIYWPTVNPCAGNDPILSWQARTNS